MDKETIKTLMDQQNSLALLLLEEKANKKTAIEETENNMCQLLIAAYDVVHEVVRNYLVKF